MLVYAHSVLDKGQEFGLFNVFPCQKYGVISK